jgi:hypothetical protein
MEHTIRRCVSRAPPTGIGHFLRKFVSVEGHTLGALLDRFTSRDREFVLAFVRDYVAHDGRD